MNKLQQQIMKVPGANPVRCYAGIANEAGYWLTGDLRNEFSDTVIRQALKHKPRDIRQLIELCRIISQEAK